MRIYEVIFRKSVRYFSYEKRYEIDENDEKAKHESEANMKQQESKTTMIYINLLVKPIIYVFLQLKRMMQFNVKNKIHHYIIINYRS